MLKSDKSFALIISLLILVNGCDKGVTGKIIADNDYFEGDVGINAYFCPIHDCESAIIESINNAIKSAHCAFYDLDLEALIEAIAKKSHSADVKVIIDNENYDGQIKGNGIKVVKSYARMHNKFCVLDGDVVLTGSTNPTKNGVNKNNNNLVLVRSDYIAKNYEDEFNELWGGIYSGGDTVKYDKIRTNVGWIENYFCPEDCALTNMGGIYRIIELIKNAASSVKVASFSLTHEGLADELLKADIKGIDVNILIESRQRNGLGSQYTRLRDFGINIKIDGNKNNMHHKFVVIDDKIVVLGSPNYTLSGNDKNDENILILFNEQIALGFAREFDRLFREGEKI